MYTIIIVMSKDSNKPNESKPTEQKPAERPSQAPKYPVVPTPEKTDLGFGNSRENLKK